MIAGRRWFLSTGSMWWLQSTIESRIRYKSKCLPFWTHTCASLQNESKGLRHFSNDVCYYKRLKILSKYLFYEEVFKAIGNLKSIPNPGICVATYLWKAHVSLSSSKRALHIVFKTDRLTLKHFDDNKQATAKYFCIAYSPSGVYKMLHWAIDLFCSGA